MREYQFDEGIHIRRHGPAGYGSYASYRDWLRDEFLFRCVYCLHREKWEKVASSFHVEHCVPIAEARGRRCDYSNLLYACQTCNYAKKDVLGIPDPCEVSFRDCLQILPDGRFKALNANGEKLVQCLQLNSEANAEYRFRWMNILRHLETTNPVLYRELMSFPCDLPDLRKKQVPINTKSESVENCFFVLRERGELPSTY
jgi:HNH endonuclease